MAGTDENPIIYPELVMPDNVERTTVTLWSAGVALDADIYRPKGLGTDNKVPAITMSHGIGGDKLTAERYAAKFAASNMIAISFTHAGWGGSRGRLLPLGDMPERGSKNEVGVNVREVRDVLDPVEWVESYRASIDFLMGEPNVDTNRIGAWGTSFGGGTAFYSAANDDRIKALAIQVPAVFPAPPPMLAMAKQRATQIARGEFDVTTSDDAMPGLKGIPNFARMAQFKVADQVDFIKVPTLIAVAENEEMFDNAHSGGAAYERLQERGIESYYEVLPGIDHYGIYFDGFDRGSQLALDWFVKHL